MTHGRRALSLLSIFAFSLASAACGDDDDGPAGAAGGSGGSGGTGAGAGSGGGGAGGAAGGGAGVRGYDAVSYDLRGSFDWGRKRLIASELITVNLADAPGPASIELDAAVAVRRVHANNADLSYGYDANAGKLRVDLSPLGTGGGERSFTVDYEADASSSLATYEGRDDDPVASRVVATDSEPDRGSRWLVAHHHPSDRALFRVELTVEPDEDVVANGARVSDETSDGKHRVRYELAQPIPTYLMAFAAGQLEHHDRATGRVPLSVWCRRGLAIEPEKHLDLLESLMASLEARLGNYPFDTYSVVLLPQQPGGMENATITFNVETSGQGELGVTLNAHELAHHWFGDWVTMRDYDDVWVKEGMATLLQYEVQRDRLDAAGKGRLFGQNLNFRPDESIVDRSLVGSAKYNSGPYSRAAWLITQIRAKVGEDAFWASLKKVLADHALGDVDGESFIRSFAPALDEASIARALGSLEQKPPPSLVIESTPGDAFTRIKFTMSDLSGTLLAPVAFTVVDAAGLPTAHELVSGVPLEIDVPAGGYLAPDEPDLHPNFVNSFAVDPGAYYGSLVPLLWPSAAPALVAIGERSAANQEEALDNYGLPSVVGPAEFVAFYATLDSQLARSSAEFNACYALDAADDEVAKADWAAVLAPVLREPSVLNFSTARAACGTELATQAFGVEFATAAQSLSAAKAGRFSYLLSFDYGPGPSFDAASLAASTAPSLQLRDRAIARLASQADGDYALSPVPLEQAPVWQAFFRDKLAGATSANRFYNTWRGVHGLGDHTALVTVAQKLQAIPLDNGTRRDIVCGAFEVATGHEGAADAFRDAAQPWDALGPEAAAALADPAACPPARRSPARARRASPDQGLLLDAPAVRAQGMHNVVEGAKE